MADDPRTAEDRPEAQIRIGQGPRNRRELLIKVMWIGVWLVFLSSPIRDLTGGRHTTAATAAGAVGLAVFVGAYLTLVLRGMGRPFSQRAVIGLLGVLAVLATVLGLGLGLPWTGLFIYVSVACGATLPPRVAACAIPCSATVMYLVQARWGDFALDEGLVMVVLIGFAMIGVSQLISTTRELRKARATVAQLAANEERLRLARDLHDLLGHSLSLITLKSELAGRMLPEHPEKAAQQVSDIEQVSRQALVDVREAVTGYRRPRLAVELAGTQVALTAAGVTAELPAEPDLAGVPEEAESALAWALREAVTNVVRHSGADRCAVRLTHRQTLDGPTFELVVEDNGSGTGNGGFGNGLTGLTERLEKAGGTLEASRFRHGFRLVARVPAAPAGDVGSGA
ncbi:histidine kinase [Streptomyces sp. SUK 48]|uniref:sensor histidine kinase n=1 Tax=Streptomyces sp. SUK 48 TaxID=2582831 RepID=UPI00129B95AD|nr:histidine kinase [Streptomyces sp. SUK 48]